MTASYQIKHYIESLPEGQVFSSVVLRALASTENIRQILSRLVKTGELQRVARGVFVKPKKVEKFGIVLPSASEVSAMLAASTGETIIVHGAEAARQLGLTTQVPLKTIFYTSGNTRTLKMAGRTVMLKHVNPSKLIAPNTVEGLAISALIYLGKEQVTTKTIAEIKKRISSEYFEAMFQLIERVPAWLANIFYRYQQDHEYE